MNAIDIFVGLHNIHIKYSSSSTTCVQIHSSCCLAFCIPHTSFSMNMCIMRPRRQMHFGILCACMAHGSWLTQKQERTTKAKKGDVTATIRLYDYTTIRREKTRINFKCAVLIPHYEKQTCNFCDAHFELF